MTRELEFRVFGIPGAQGSKVRTKYGVRESSKKVAPWRQDVVAAALEAKGDDWETYTGPVAIRVIFYLQRPKHHYRTGLHAGELRPNAPGWVITKPDIDKITRSTLDALTTAGIFRDDSLVALIYARKVYDPIPGAFISLKPAVL